MRLKTIKDFLAYLEHCHRELAELYQSLSHNASDDKVKLLLDFMSNKELLTSIYLDEYTLQASPALLDTWLDNVSDQRFKKYYQQITLNPDLAIEDVVALAINLYMQLIDLMQTAAYKTHTIEAEIALENLSNKQEEILHQVVIASHEFEFM